MKSFKTVLNEGRGDERFLHAIIKGAIKEKWGFSKGREVIYYDSDASNNKDAHKIDLYKAVRVYVVRNAKGDLGYDYEAI
jgi:hypothetical protein